MWTFRADQGGILGDQWAVQLRAVWARMKAADPDLCSLSGAYAFWQWAHCQTAGMTSRIVASPECYAITGKAYPTAEQQDEILALNDRLLAPVKPRTETNQGRLF